MAKTGGHFERCNVGCVEAHNKRTQAYLDGVKAAGLPLYFFEELTVNNTHWESDRQEFAGKTCAQIFDSLKKLYTEKTGQAPQLKDRTRINKKTGMKQTIAGWSPIREAVIPIKEDTTVEDFKPVFDWLRQNGLEPIRLDLHKDEGYKNEDTGERKMNYHAHLVVCWVDLTTGRTANLKKDKMSEFNQKVLPDALGMDAGTSKAITGAEHLAPAAQRAKAEKERLEAEIEKLKLSKVAKEKTLGFLGIRTIKDKEIETLREEKKAIETRLIEETTNHTADIKKLQLEANKRTMEAQNNYISEDGEVVLSESTREHSVGKEPSYYKVYLKDIALVFGLTPAEQKVFEVLCANMGFGNRVVLIKAVKNKMTELTGYSFESIRKAIQVLTAKKLLIPEDRACYIVNPNYAGQKFM